MTPQHFGLKQNFRMLLSIQWTLKKLKEANCKTLLLFLKLTFKTKSIWISRDCIEYLRTMQRRLNFFLRAQHQSRKHNLHFNMHLFHKLKFHNQLNFRHLFYAFFNWHRSKQRWKFLGNNYSLIGTNEK